MISSDQTSGCNQLHFLYWMYWLHITTTLSSSLLSYTLLALDLLSFYLNRLSFTHPESLCLPSRSLLIIPPFSSFFCFCFALFLSLVCALPLIEPNTVVSCAQCCLQCLQFITLAARSMGLLMSLRLKSIANRQTISADRLTLNASQDGWHTLKMDQYITIKIIQKHPSSCLAFVRIHLSQHFVDEDR